MTTDPFVLAVLGGVKMSPSAAVLTRERGACAFNKTHWGELAGRLPDGAWAELRVHHRPDERSVQAALVLYQPLSRGGRTIVVGDVRDRYRHGGIDACAEKVVSFLVDCLDSAKGFS